MPDSMKVAMNPEVGMHFFYCQGGNHYWVIRIDSIDPYGKIHWSHKWQAEAIEDAEGKWNISPFPKTFSQWANDLILLEDVTEVRLLSGEVEISWEV